jgi:hypothetical protein
VQLARVTWVLYQMVIHLDHKKVLRPNPSIPRQILSSPFSKAQKRPSFFPPFAFFLSFFSGSSSFTQILVLMEIQNQVFSPDIVFGLGSY